MLKNLHSQMALSEEAITCCAFAWNDKMAKVIMIKNVILVLICHFCFNDVKTFKIKILQSFEL